MGVQGDRVNRRSFFATLLAALSAPFVAKAAAPVVWPANQFGIDFEWPAIEKAQPRWPAGLKPFAVFPAPIESMQTVTMDGDETHLLVIAGGVGYLVDKHGNQTMLTRSNGDEA